MSVILQVSDTHFGTERPEVVDALRRFAAALQADLLVLSGDITQRARAPEFAAARAFAEALATKAVLAIPGNHDIPLYDLAARVLDPYGRYAEAFGRDLEPTYESQDVLVLGVNTTRARRHKHGEVSAAQIERVVRRLRSCAPQKLRIVVTHQPIHVPRSTDEHNLLRGHARAARAWADAGADLVMGGHIHLPYVRKVVHPLWVVQAGTAVSRRVRAGAEANSVNVVRYDPSSVPGACVVERWDHHAASDAFTLADRVRIELHRTKEKT